jgi:hypothetical protein
MISTSEITSSIETGKLQVMHLKRYWNKSILKRHGKLQPGAFPEEWKKDTTLLTVLGLGLEQTGTYLFQTAPSFEEFENWILDVTGGPDPEKISRFNQLFTGENNGIKSAGPAYELLTKDDLDFWDQHGYLIVRNAVDKEDCDETIAALCNFIGIDRYDQDTWYNDHPAKQGIMVQLFQHIALEKNRNAFKIRKAYEELWQRTDLWVNTDRVGFNPPENEVNKFQGPRLHWDVSLHLPIPFGTQGILYLSDTAENQGAFTLIPGFQNRVEDWLHSLPQGANPRQQNL